MEKFTTLSGIAAAMPIANIDTDKIIPARFLKTIKRTGLGVHLFDAIRYRADGTEEPSFILNRAPWREAKILIGGENFGCGSSREHAPWALVDFGIRAVIAPSFADIFYNNSLKNGLLLVRLPKEACERLAKDAAMGGNARLTVDLDKQVVVRPDGEKLPFAIDPLRKKMLLEGLDDIGLTMGHTAAIGAFEVRRRREWPWLPSTALS